MLTINKIENIIQIFTRYMIVEEGNSVEINVRAQITVDNVIDILFAYYPLSAYHYTASTHNIEEADKLLLKHSTKYFCNDYAYFVYLRSYARKIGNRLETWPETVYRYITFMRNCLQDKLTIKMYQKLYRAILNMQILPSMRLMQFAGKVVEQNNIAAYNCCYVAPNCIKDLVDIMYILMCGTGVGFSVRSNIQQLPTVAKYNNEILYFQITDSKEGWCDSFHYLLNALYAGQNVVFDYSFIRVEGAELVTSGGIAPGPEPLRKLHDFTRKLFTVASEQERKLTSLEVHDLLCMVGQIVLVGGGRRSAMISLSDVHDKNLALAKSNDWYITHPIRSQANNSAVYTSKPDMFTFLQEWNNLVQSRSGERGIFSLSHIEQQLPARRVKFYREMGIDMTELGTNPCGEIFLQSQQFCNLSSIICSAHDTVISLRKKVKLATILGTYQATLTNFSYVSVNFKKNCDAERLLGVSLSGQTACPIVTDIEVLQQLREHSIQINQQYAKLFSINSATAITCVKPDGTTGAITGSPSGLHFTKAAYYWRRVRHLAKSSLSIFLKEQGVHVEPCALENTDLIHAKTWVFKFPIAAKENCALVKDYNAIQQCENWLRCKISWCEHNPSVTIDVKEHEWLQVGQWVYEHWQHVGGMSFCPYFDDSNCTYQQLPFEEISKTEYEKAISVFPSIDYSTLLKYASEDTSNTVMACTAKTCLYA